MLQGNLGLAGPISYLHNQLFGIWSAYKVLSHPKRKSHPFLSVFYAK